MSRRLALALTLLSLLMAGLIPARSTHAAPPSPWDSPEAIPGELVVGFESSTRAAAFRAPAGILAEKGSRQLRRLGATVVKVPPGQEQKYARELAGQPGVEFVEPNYVVTAELIPNDPLWAGQYGPVNVQAPAAWDVTTGSSSVIVAVIDSGIDAGHPEFAGRILAGYDFVDDDSTPQDGCGHGTHVAGTIAAKGNNAQGVAGLAWATSIMPLRALGDTCSGTTADIAEALVWAVERGATVINLSLGTAFPSTLLENGTYYAYSHGAAIFAASGNSGGSIVLYPAAYSWVLAVGATDSGNARASFSNAGAALDVMAPGVSILSTTPQGSFYYKTLLGTPSNYGSLSGTSMATAHASGAAALLATQAGFDSADAIYQGLEETALDLGLAGRDDQTGYGLIQIAEALAFNPTATPPPPITPVVSYDILNSLSCGNLVSYGWRDAASGGLAAALPVFGNDGSATVSLPFTFNFGGVDYSTLTVSANGYATFNGLGNVSANFLLPGHAQPDNFLAPFWDDLTASTGGILYQQTNGTAPNREYVVEWHAVAISGETSPLTFELVLFESSGDILFQYETLTGMDGDGASATIGVEYADGFAASQYSYNRAGAVQEGQALLFRPYGTGGTPPSEACALLLLPETGFAPGRSSSLPEQPADRAYYAPGDMKLAIPSLKVNIPVVGVPKVDGAWDVSWLWGSAGYLNGSAFPTTSGNSVLTGHVYLPTGLPGPFVNVGSLKWGDQIIVHYAGQHYVYSVRTVQILEPDDVNTVMKHQESPWITLLTCKSYDEKTDSYRQRVSISAVLIAVR